MTESLRTAIDELAKHVAKVKAKAAAQAHRLSAKDRKYHYAVLRELSAAEAQVAKAYDAETRIPERIHSKVKPYE